MDVNSRCRSGFSVSIIVVSLLCIPAVSRGQGCPNSGQQSNGPDVIVGDIQDVLGYGTVGSLAGLALGTTSCNLGNAQLLWDQCSSLTHPVIGGNLYKWSTVNGATRFEQVGQSWLKNAFTALQGSVCCSNCLSSGTGTRLGVGCSDPYSASLNGGQGSLGPKYAVNAHTGVFLSVECSTHPSGGNNGRLEVALTDLVATTGGSGATTRFFGQCQYVTPDDASNHNQNNNASYREVTVSGSGTSWNFGLLGSTARMIPAVRHWKEIEPGVVETDIATPEDDGFPGLVILDAKATDIGGGVYHYEYAINNLNSDRSIQSFSVPVSAGVVISNIGFHDVPYRYGDGVNAAGTGGTSYDGTDWPGSVSGGTVTWSTQTYAVNRGANAIRWGTLYNFRFDANVAPAPSNGNSTLVEFKPPSAGGSPPSIQALTVIPGLPACVPPDVAPIHDGIATCGASFTSGNPSLVSGTGPMSWSLDTAPPGMTIEPTTGSVTWPNPVTVGSPYLVTSKATNSCGSSSMSWHVTVSPNPPTINTIADAFAVCGAPFTSVAPTTTPSGVTPISWALTSSPAGMTIDSSTGVVSWPNPVATGAPFTITVQASSANGCGDSLPQSWQLGVVLGDFDADGLVTELDIDSFVNDLLADPQICAGDLNGDGFVDGNDISAFNAALGL